MAVEKSKGILQIAEEEGSTYRAPTREEFIELLKKAPPVPLIFMGPGLARELDEALLSYFEGRIGGGK